MVSPICGGSRLSIDAIAFKIKKKALEKGSDPKNAITTAFEHLDFVVQAFHKTAGEPIRKVIGDFVQPVLKRSKERIEAGQAAETDFISPFEQTIFAIINGQV